MTDHRDLEPDDGIPLDADDLLIQRYLDGTLDHEDAVEVELRADEDEPFGARIRAYEMMFTALDRSALARAAVSWSDESMPAAIVDAALNRWHPDEVEVAPDRSVVAEPSRSPIEVATSWIDRLFGSWKPAAVAFALADLVLVGLVGVAAVIKDPTITADRLVGSLDGVGAAGADSALSAVPGGFGGIDLVLGIVACLSLMAVGLVLLAVAPERTRNLRRTLEASPGTSLVIGSLASFGLGLLTLVLLPTIIGGPVVGGFTVLLWAAGMTGLLEAVGDRVPLPDSLRSRGWDLAAGTAVFALLAVLGSAGGWFAALATLIALGLGSTAVGATVLSGLGRAPYPRAD